MKTIKKSRYHIGLLLLSSLIHHSCGVGFGADAGENERQTELPTQFSEASANISFDTDNRLILINLSSLAEQPILVPRFPCSNITIEQDLLEYELSQQGRALNLGEQDLSRKAELSGNVSVLGVDPDLFAVWEFPETIRGNVREQITVTITDQKITYRNECRQES
ncbi:MAG: hypothetical protein ACOH5I_17655 [Oligoflexus sp.]